jgi:hypothetical protein
MELNTTVGRPSRRCGGDHGDAVFRTFTKHLRECVALPDDGPAKDNGGSSSNKLHQPVTHVPAWWTSCSHPANRC